MDILSNDNYTSRRSCALSSKGMVASSQYLATQAGLKILAKGGNAADAAIATTACLQVTQPCSTGLGGDCFVLYYDCASGKIAALNGSGRAGKRLTIERMKKIGFGERIAIDSAHTVTIPGAPAAWVDFHSRFGELPMSVVLEPAIALAEEGFPVAQYTALWWQQGAKDQLSKHRHGHELTIDNRGPEPGELIHLPNLANSLKILAEEGKEPFYQGRIAEKVIEAVNEAGGDLITDDFAEHRSTWVEPIGIEFKGNTVWECPPNGQGLAALIALNVVKHLELEERDSVGRYHQLIEAMRIGFADAAAYICDPEFGDIPLADLLSEAYGKERASTLNLNNMTVPSPGLFENPGAAGTDTVYFCTADQHGNACSFINSNFMGFGSGIVPEGCGYSLQNRGHGFVLEEGHPNALEPGKRPYHTIIPGMITNMDGSLFSAFGVMGGMMQPQGHLQVAVGLLHDQLDPQGALDAPRFQLAEGFPDGAVMLENPLQGEISKGLEKRKHSIQITSGRDRHLFGLGQVIMRRKSGNHNVYWGGSDSRGDGCVLGL